ncbi:MAG: TonB-dependent receptor [Myxococcota bacterium]
MWVALTALGRPVYAQGELELETVVTGARETRDLKADRAAAGSVLLAEDFDDAGDSIPDVLDREAGVRVTNLGGPAAFSTLSIRGSTSDQVMVVLDGVPISSALGGPVDLSRLPLGHIDRIEIYRGSSPLSFGQSAIGGVLSVTTRSANERELTLSGSVGSFGERAARAFYGDAGEDWDVGIGLDYSGWSGGFRYDNDNGTRFDVSDDRVVARRNNDFDHLNAVAKSSLMVDEKWRLQFSNWFFWRDQGVPGLGQLETEQSRYTSTENLTSVVLQGRDLFDAIDVEARASLHLSEANFQDPLNEIGLTLVDSQDRSYSPYASASFTYSPSWLWELTGQATYRFESFDSNADTVGVESAQRHTASAGLEGALVLETLDLRVIPSLRVEQLDNRSESLEPAAQTRASWRMALVNQSLPDTRFTLTGGRGFRFPSLFEIFGNSGRVLGNPALEPESANSIDAGVIYDSTLSPYVSRLRIDAYAFYSRVDNLIQFVQTAQRVARPQNVDRATLWGAEAGLRSELLGHLRLRGNYTFLDARNAGDISARQDRFLPLRPASKWYLRAEGFMRRWGGIDELAAFVDLEWIAGNFLDNANLVASSDRFYLNTGISAELPFQACRLSVTARNLTNEQTLDLIGYPLPGRSFHVSLSVGALP